VEFLVDCQSAFTCMRYHLARSANGSQRNQQIRNKNESPIMIHLYDKLLSHMLSDTASCIIIYILK